MEKLIAGIHRFRNRYRSEHREALERLAAHGQQPGAAEGISGEPSPPAGNLMGRRKGSAREASDG